MKVGRVAVDGGVRTALIDPDAGVARVLAAGHSVIDALTAADRGALERSAEPVELSGLRLLAPLNPPSIRDFSVFEQHVEGIRMGQGATVPDIWYEAPFCYFSNPGAVSGPGDEIQVPPGCGELDLELEVAAVIGKAGSNLTPQQAGEHIAGYTIFNDWSARDLQFAEMRLGLGICKGKDFASTLGPWIVTPDELEPHHRGDRLDLDMRATVNGRELGDDTLANMAWSFDELLAHASRGTWIRAGDVIGSGTCGAGCLLELRGRFGEDDYPWLAPGDTVTLTVEGLGSLTNTIATGVDPVPLPPARPGRLRSRAGAEAGR